MAKLSKFLMESDEDSDDSDKDKESKTVKKLKESVKKDAFIASGK